MLLHVEAHVVLFPIQRKTIRAMLYIKHKGRRRHLFGVPHKDLNKRGYFPKAMNFLEFTKWKVSKKKYLPFCKSHQTW
jgi:hypothetical protein